MLCKTIRLLSVLILLPSWPCSAQKEALPRLILKVDETVNGPMGGERSSSCLRIYSDGRVIYASWRNSAMKIIDKETGRESRPGKTISVEHHLDSVDGWELPRLLESKALKNIPNNFDPPHRPIDYFEQVTIGIFGAKGTKKLISTREYYVASLEEKTRYPSALILLMEKIDQIEKAASEQGRPTEIPSDCQSKAP